MARTVMLHVRLDGEMKTEGNAILASMGLTAADAVRLLYHRIVTDRAFPLELKVPDAATREAMAEADAVLTRHAARYDGSAAMITALDD